MELHPEFSESQKNTLNNTPELILAVLMDHASCPKAHNSLVPIPHCLQKQSHMIFNNQKLKREDKAQKEIEMKIQCDVCYKEEASVFCSADEAALCHACDHTIHHANKLASKHTRFYLHNPTSKHSPLCDICQERRAYIFCREDRAILCTECDLPIHGANENTQKHNRFLLTGMKVGASSSNPTLQCSNSTATESELRNSHSKANMSSDTGSVSTSSISEYLIETIPGYCMGDLLDASLAPNGFLYKDYEYHSEIQHQDLFQENMCSFIFASCSPQSQVRFPKLSTSSVPQIDSSAGVKEVPKAKAVEGYYNDYTVPSVTPPLIKNSRRSR